VFDQNKSGGNMAKQDTQLAHAAARDIKEVADQIREVNFWSCVCFADTVNRYCEITMKKDDISPLHALAMNNLVKCGGASTPTQLAEKMFRSKHSVTKIVDNLEKEGFIVRDFTSKDRRVTQVRMTTAGLEYVKNNQSKGNKRAKQVMDCLTADEQKTLISLTAKMSARMTDILEKI
jgi:MarR family transcriptional regulator, organic hydroperoxide resistance regulator